MAKTGPPGEVDTAPIDGVIDSLGKRRVPGSAQQPDLPAFVQFERRKFGKMPGWPAFCRAVLCTGTQRQDRGIGDWDGEFRQDVGHRFRPRY